MAAIIRLSAIGRGKFSSRHMVGCEQRSVPLSGSRPTAIRIGAQRVAVVGVLVAGRDQQCPEANHLGEPMLDPLRRPRVFDAACQTLGEAEPTLDLGQHQHAAIRGQASAVERDLHGLAGDG
jgi:hypothetical protein